MRGAIEGVRGRPAPAAAAAPRPANTYDLVKLAFLACMLVDHVGAFWRPDEPWWRVVGRLTFPLALVLVGYSGYRRAPPRLWAAAAIAGAALWSLRGGPLPLPFLLGVAAARLLLPATLTVGQGWSLLALLLPLSPFIDVLVEYGGQAPLFAAVGRLLRAGVPRARVAPLAGAVFGFYAFLQVIAFGFTPAQGAVLLALLALAALGCLAFELRPLPLPRPLLWAARRSLEIYAGHLVLFALARLWLGR